MSELRKKAQAVWDKLKDIRISDIDALRALTELDKALSADTPVDEQEVKDLREVKRVLEAATGGTVGWMKAREAALAPFDKPYEPLLDDEETARENGGSYAIQDRRLMLVDALVALHTLLLNKGDFAVLTQWDLLKVIEDERAYANRSRKR